MPVLIDGNNLLHAARAVESNPAIGRSMLCGRLGEWALRRRQKVHVVFDGPAPPGALRAQIGHRAIDVSYSGTGTTADVAIVNRMDADSAARRLLVVSTDHEVRKAARRRRAESVRSEPFWQMVVQDLARPVPAPKDPPQKRAGLAAGEADEWLTQFGFNNGGAERRSAHQADDDSPPAGGKDAARPRGEGEND